MRLDYYKKELKSILRELNLMKNSIHHLKYIINYITRRHLVHVEGIHRACVLLNDLSNEINSIRIKIQNIINFLNNIDEAVEGAVPERILEQIKLIKGKVSNVEKVISIIERYIIQKGECITVVQNWPSVYTLSSVTSPEIVYVVYESFAKLVLRLLGFNDLDENNPIVVFGGARSGGTDAETYTDYRIIILPRQARYDIRYLTYILHEAIHIATRHKSQTDPWQEIHNLSNWFIEKILDYISSPNISFNNNIMNRVEDEVLVELIKYFLLKRIVHNIPDADNEDKTISWLLDFHDKIDYFINKIAHPCKVLNIENKRCIEFINEFLNEDNKIAEYINSINYDGYENDLNRFRAILYLLGVIEELLERAEDNNVFTTFFPSSFMYAYRVLFDDVANARLNEANTELEAVNVWKSIVEEINDYLRDLIYIFALIKLPTELAWSNNVEEYLNQEIITYLNNQLRYNTNLLEIYAVTGWFDYLIIMETLDVISVVGVIDELLANDCIEDGAVITGKILHIQEGYKSEEKMYSENVCSYAFLLIDIIHGQGHQSYSEQINQIKNTIEQIIDDMRDQLEFAKLTTKNKTTISAIFHVFGKYDMAVLLKIKKDMNSLIELITRLKSLLIQNNIIIETQTIPCCLYNYGSH